MAQHIQHPPGHFGLQAGPLAALAEPPSNGPRQLRYLGCGQAMTP